jgi:ATP-dependent helicase/DNAse subunit B
MMSLQKNGNESNLEKVSYSKISTFEQCPRKFYLKYELKKRSNAISLPLEVGTITHYGKELIGLALLKGDTPDYEAIKEVVMSGCSESKGKIVDENGEGVAIETEADIVKVLGISELRDKYFFDWLEKCDKSNLTYDEKLRIYFDNLDNLENEDSWNVVACELEFDFPYKDKFRLYGFIDRIDESACGDYRVVDYKSSKKIFDDKYTKTPLQMFIYTLAVEHVYGKVPIEHLYDFMLIGEMQNVCSKGYYKRGEAKLMKLWDELETCRANGVWKPKPSKTYHSRSFDSVTFIEARAIQ